MGPALVAPEHHPLDQPLPGPQGRVPHDWPAHLHEQGTAQTTSSVPWVPMNVVPCEHCGKKNRVPAAVRGTPRCAQCHRPLPWITDAGDDDFAEVADQSTVPVLVDLWAPWCGPCRMVSPALERLAHEMAGRIKLVKVDVDTAPRTGQRFAVQGIPTLMLLDRGRVIARQTGAAPEPALRTWIEQGLRSRDDARADQAG